MSALCPFALFTMLNMPPTPRPTTRLHIALLAARRARADRPWLALLAVPLAVIPVMLLGLYPLLVPLAVLAWWWSPQDAVFGWVVAMEMGLVGTVWAFGGVEALVRYPSHRIAVGLVWVASISFVGGLSAVLHRRYGRGY